MGERDVVVVAALRTPICRARRGGLAHTTPDVLLRTVFRAILNETGVDPTAIQDIVVGNVLEPGAGAALVRVAALQAGIPASVPCAAVNRQCASGLQAFATVAGAIRAGFIDVGLAGGVESMSLSQAMEEAVPTVGLEQVHEHPVARDCLLPMGVTSDNVAAEFGVPREAQDAFALASHRKAATAQREGWFDREVVPVQAVAGAGPEDSPHTTVVARDDGIRGTTSLDKLRKLRPVFTEGGSTTAGNASQVSDGAAAVLVMTRARAEALGLPPLAVLRAFAVVGVPPAVMGIGPAKAIPAALNQAGLALQDIDVFELNEAFASQAVYCIEKLKLDPAKVNPNGGAIALGHPLGCTGARQIATLVHELARTRQHTGLVSMCMGTGMGACAVFDRGPGGGRGPERRGPEARARARL